MSSMLVTALDQLLWVRIKESIVYKFLKFKFPPQLFLLNPFKAIHFKRSKQRVIRLFAPTHILSIKSRVYSHAWQEAPNSNSLVSSPGLIDCRLQLILHLGSEEGFLLIVWRILDLNGGLHRRVKRV